MAQPSRDLIFKEIFHGVAFSAPGGGENVRLVRRRALIGQPITALIRAGWPY